MKKTLNLFGKKNTLSVDTEEHYHETPEDFTCENTHVHNSRKRQRQN
jgi:hypothetical protein